MEVNVQAKFDEMIEPKKLKDHPKNRNKHGQDQIERLAELYKAHGFRHPIIVSKNTGFIVAGHGRKLAAIRAGIKKVPVVFQEFENDDAEYAFLISDNAIALWAELDMSAINVDVQDLGPNFNIEWLGIKGFTLDMSEKEGLTDDDEIPEQVEPIAKLGDLFQLGEHRLLCGDSTDQAAVELLMNGEKADMVFTDPPYGMNLDTDFESMHSDNKAGSRTNRPVIGDNEEYDPSHLLEIDSKELFIWGADYFCQKIPTGGSWVVWDKRESENMDAVHGAGFELCWSREKHKKMICRNLWSGFQGMKKDDAKRVHPTQKPIQLITWFFDQWGKDTKSVIDLFGGSGSTLIACEKTNRKCFMMELDPHYIDVIIQRWQNFTGQKAVKLNE